MEKLKIIFEKNNNGREDIPEMAVLYVDNQKITFAPVRVYFEHRNQCLICGLKAENGYNGELNCLCKYEPGAFLKETWTLEEARLRAKKELEETYAKIKNTPSTYYAVTVGNTIPQLFRFGKMKDNSVIAQSENAEELIQQYGDDPKYTIWEVRRGGAMRDYVQAYCTGEK